MGDCRSVYLEACAEVASAFLTDGFRYLKSRHAMVKKEPDLAFWIGFQSDPRNWLVEHPVQDGVANIDDLNFFAPIEEIEREMTIYGSVYMSVSVSVGSARIQRWRKSLPYPLRTNDVIAGAYLSDLIGTGLEWMVVNLANTRARHKRIGAIVSMIRNEALPYFERFRDPKRVVADVISTSVPGMGIRERIDYAFFHCGKETAMSLLQSHLKSYPYLRDGYKNALDDFRQRGMPAPNTSFGNIEPQLAFIALALGLEPIE